jgi:hypothetical protein
LAQTFSQEQAMTSTPALLASQRVVASSMVPSSASSWLSLSDFFVPGSSELEAVRTNAVHWLAHAREAPAFVSSHGSRLREAILQHYSHADYVAEALDQWCPTPPVNVATPSDICTWAEQHAATWTACAAHRRIVYDACVSDDRVCSADLCAWLAAYSEDGVWQELPMVLSLRFPFDEVVGIMHQVCAPSSDRTTPLTDHRHNIEQVVSADGDVPMAWWWAAVQSVSMVVTHWPLLAAGTGCGQLLVMVVHVLVLCPFECTWVQVQECAHALHALDHVGFHAAVRFVADAKHAGKWLRSLNFSAECAGLHGGKHSGA